MSQVKVVAMTKDGVVMPIDAALLDAISFREFVLRRLVQAGLLVPSEDQVAGAEYKTEFTEAQAKEFEEQKRRKVPQQETAKVVPVSKRR